MRASTDCISRAEECRRLAKRAAKPEDWEHFLEICDASDHPSTRVDHDGRGRRMFAYAAGYAPPACAAGFAPPACAAGFAPPIVTDHAPRVAQRRKTAVQLASTPVQQL
jgi:hypothetical protein